MIKIKDKVKYIKHIRIPPPFEIDEIYEIIRVSSDEKYIWVKEFPNSPFLADRFELVNEQNDFFEKELLKLEEDGSLDIRDNLAYRKLMDETLTKEELLNKLKDGENK